MCLDVNFLAIFSLAVFFVILRMIWFSPACFGKGLIEEHKVSTLKLYVGDFFIGLVMTYVHACILKATSSIDLEVSAFLGFWIWVGYISSVQFGEMLRGQKSGKFFQVDSTFYFIFLTTATIVLMFWTSPHLCLLQPLP